MRLIFFISNAQSVAAGVKHLARYYCSIDHHDVNKSINVFNKHM